ncbi:MAG: helix-turn-helix domain-containing protein [Bifidobacteriaceae bacterium]|jgi:transcriptional regulator with XRE-family HTH domain|nr:helix-turn-helix domain-containing protein [Bifidobacteriaceae bacterium]
MSRPNQPRSTTAEVNLARRIKFEREQRDWSPAQLAEQMTAIGCSIQTSAIYRIEARENRRRISVDELVTFARVFDTSVDDLLRPFDFVLVERLQKVEVDYLEAVESLADAADAVLRKGVDLIEFMTADNRAAYSEADARFEGAAHERRNAGASPDPSQMLPGVRPRPQRWAYSFEQVADKALELETLLFFTALDVCRADRGLDPLPVSDEGSDEPPIREGVD